MRPRNVHRFHLVKSALIRAGGTLTEVSLTNPAAMAQTDGTMSHFEVVSIRLNNQNTPAFGKCTGGPGMQSPTLWICNQTNLVSLETLCFRGGGV
jgi:hypothetical protein